MPVNRLQADCPRKSPIPDPFCFHLRGRIAQQYGVLPSEILAGNGTSELLYLLPRAIKPKRAVIPVPSYVDYEYSARAADIVVVYVHMDEKSGFQFPLDRLESTLRPGDVVLLGRPNNPIGAVSEAEEIRTLARKNSEVFFVVDQAFYDFVGDTDSLVQNRPKNVVVLFSLTKIFAIPGIRVGWLVGDEKFVERLRRLQAPWSVNVFAQAIAERALEDKALIELTRKSIGKVRGKMAREIRGIEGLYVYPSEANFLLVRIQKRGLDAVKLRELLLNYKIIIRCCDNFVGLDKTFFRISVRSEEENQRLINALKEVLGAY